MSRLRATVRGFKKIAFKKMRLMIVENLRVRNIYLSCGSRLHLGQLSGPESHPKRGQQGAHPARNAGATRALRGVEPEPL